MPHLNCRQRGNLAPVTDLLALFEFDHQVSLTEFRFHLAEICQRCSTWRTPVVRVHALALIFQIVTGKFVINFL